MKSLDGGLPDSNQISNGLIDLTVAGHLSFYSVCSLKLFLQIFLFEWLTDHILKQDKDFMDSLRD